MSLCKNGEEICRGRGVFVDSWTQSIRIEWDFFLLPRPIHSELARFLSFFFKSQEKKRYSMNECLFLYWSTIYLSIYPSVGTFIYAYRYPSIHPISIHPFINPCVLSSIHLPTHPSIYYLVVSITQNIHPSIHFPWTFFHFSEEFSFFQSQRFTYCGVRRWFRHSLLVTTKWLYQITGLSVDPSVGLSVSNWFFEAFTRGD